MGPRSADVFSRLRAFGHRIFLVAVFSAVCFLAAAPAAVAQGEFVQSVDSEILFKEPEILNVGVLTTEGVTRAIESWRPTIDLLNREADIAGLPYRFVLKPHSLDPLNAALQNKELDLMLSNPALFVAAEVEHGARAVLSRARMWEDRTYSTLGTLIFTRQDSTDRQIEHLRNKRLMAVGRQDFSGWWLAKQEFLRRRIDPERYVGELVFADGNEREVVYAVRTGLVDAGVVRAGVLESLSAEGAISLDDFAPISLQLNEDYPFMTSTKLYSEWVMSAMPNVKEEVLAHVINVLLNVELDSVESAAAGNTVWQAPRNYQNIHDLLISLRARPYENYVMQAAGRIYRSYRIYILGFVGLILMSLGFLVFQLRRNMRIAEQNRDVLQSALRSQVFYRSAVEEHTVFCMLDTRGRITHANPSFCQTTDRPRSDLLGSYLMDILPDKEQSMLQGDIMSSMRDGQPWDGSIKLFRADGSVAWTQCTVIPVSGSQDELSEIALVATDMTQTRKGISDTSFNDSLQLIEDQVIVFRPEMYDLIFCNKAAEAYFVRRRANIDEWQGRKVSEFITDEDMRALAMRCESLQEGPQRRMTWEVVAGNGTPFEVSLEYVQPDDDEPRFVAMYRDITARKVAEKAKNDFVATVSHELRTPLTSMKGALGLALSGAIGEMPDQMNKMVTMASNNCDKLVTLINDMLDIEKLSEGSLEFDLVEVNLQEVIEEVSEANKIKGEKRAISLRLHVEDNDDDGLVTLGEKTRLIQLFENVLDNAVKFSDEASEVIVSLKVHAGRLRVSIRDFGCGIPSGSRSTIFEKFTQADMGDTRAQGGTGLGLAVAKALTEGHNGRIFFASEEEVGTEFFVDLPRVVKGQVVSLEEANKAAEEAAKEEAATGSDSDAKKAAQGAMSYEGLEVTQFSQAGFKPEQIAEEGEAFEGPNSIQNLLVNLRSGGFEVDIEAGSVSVAQVVSGKGVVGQSTIFSWLSDEGRNLIIGLKERNKLAANVSVSVIQAKAIDDNLSDALMLNGVRANLYTNWLLTLPELSDKEDLKFDLMAVANGNLPSLDGEEINMSAVEDVSQAMVLSSMEKFDAVLHFDTIGLANCMTVIPIVGGKLPSTVPVVLVVSQTDSPESERGVVTKFARSSPSGRGKSRRKSRG